MKIRMRPAGNSPRTSGFRPLVSSLHEMRPSGNTTTIVVSTPEVALATIELGIPRSN